MKRILLTLLTLVLGLNLYAQISFGESTIFNDGWKFKLGDDTAAVASDYDDSKWQNVSLPHDWSVKGTLSPDLASCTGYLPAGIAWYRKTFDGAQFSAEQVYIYFEGVYNRSTVYLNGHELGHRPNGYISFAYDLTPYLNRQGENVLAVRVDHSRIADSRWYTGSGIYRDVYVVEAGKVHFSQWGVGYQLSSIDDKKAVISVDAAIDGLDSNKYKVNLILKDAKGAVVARTSAAAKQEQVLSLTLKNPKRWSLSEPYLYSLEAQIVAGKEVVDATSIPVGLRTLQFDADKGFALNGSWIKVKGVCLHHDAGVLGAAVPEDVWLRRLQNLKSIGVNAIRTSHNPQAPVFYDICDRIGLLVMDEAFDEWEFAKRKWVEGWNVGTPAFDGTFDFFEEWAETDVRDMVRRDRNHPSIFLWSIGNEVDYPNDPYSHPILDGGNSDFTQKAHGGYNPDAPNAMRIGEIAKRLAAVVRDVDASRPVTGALAGVAMSNQTAYPEAVDVVGYNYTESRYISDHKTYPNRVIYGSENRSDYSAWTAVRDNEHIFGQFIWTGTDYLGESNAWPSRGFYSGMLDLGSYPKPSGYFRASLWSETPMCYIGTTPFKRDTNGAWDTWNYQQGQSVHVVCYTNASSAALFLNGKQVGERTPYDMKDGIISWDVPFEAGTLKAVAYDEAGAEVAQYEIRTSYRPYSLRVTADKAELSAGQVAHLTVEVLDDNGNVVKLADNEITCTVNGPAKLLGLEGSNNTDMTSYSDNVHRAYRGRLLAYIQASEGSGEVVVSFNAPYLQGVSIKLNVLN
ncbi:MAG: DUF4982 domain-containing protein [Bacteroidales bacterium]|nr:DUF4982 domain-containing protein [Bacteroidales bacterium]